MYQVAIVDDEPVIRFGIKASVDWGKENIGTAVDFSNGEEAWRRIEREPVDILITDIKMPLMDGLELARRTLSRYPDTKVILVSSYNDFEYVRQGLKLGVTDYLLKPALEPESLLELVRKCLRQIEEERGHASERILLQSEKRARERKRHESVIKRAIGQGGEGLHPELAPPWMSGGYTVCTVWLNSLRETEERFGDLHVAVLLEEMQEAFYGITMEGVAFQKRDRSLAMVLPAPDGQEPAETIKELAAAWSARSGVDVSIGYTIGTDISDIRSVFDLSERLAGRRFYEGDGIYGAPDKTGEAGTPSSGGGPPLQELRRAVHSRDADLADEAVRAWGAYWQKRKPDPDTVRKEAFEILTTLFMHEQEWSLLLEGFEEHKQCGTFEELTGLLAAQIRSCRKSNPGGPQAVNGNKQLIDKSIEYIQTRFTGDITLQQAADHVHMSKNYFCLQFKQHTGQNFIDYVIRLRIARAKEWLADSGIKIYEVAERSGFHDVKYFSKLFKKMTGYSPVEYRERLQAE